MIRNKCSFIPFSLVYFSICLESTNLVYSLLILPPGKLLLIRHDPVGEKKNQKPISTIPPRFPQTEISFFLLCELIVFSFLWYFSYLLINLIPAAAGLHSHISFFSC